LSAKNRESWRQISDETRLLLPLYTEKIHIVVTPYGKNDFKDLMQAIQERRPRQYRDHGFWQHDHLFLDRANDP